MLDHSDHLGPHIRIAGVGQHLKPIGGVVGAIASMAYFGPGMTKAMFLFQEKEIFKIGEAADKAYYEQAGETAIWALTFYIETLDELKVERSVAEVENPYFILDSKSLENDLMMSHIKLVKLYKQTGNEEKANYHFTRAKESCVISTFKNMKLDSIDDCLEFLEKYDSRRSQAV